LADAVNIIQKKGATEIVDIKFSTTSSYNGSEFIVIYSAIIMFKLKGGRK